MMKRLRALTLPQDEKQLSLYLCSQLRTKDMPQELWLHLSRKGFVRGAVDPPSASDLEDCLVAAREYAKDHPQLVRPTKRKSWKPRFGKLLGPDVRARAKILYDRQKDAAREHKELLKARKRLLGGGTLSDSEAASVLTSAANRFLHPEFFTQNRVPIVGHTTSMRLPDGRLAAAWDDNLILRIEWPGGDPVDTPYRKEWRRDIDGAQERIAIPNQTGGFYEEYVAKWSVLDELREASIAVSRVAPWKAHEAVWFILTDRLLSDAPIQVWYSAGRSGGLAWGRLTLEIDAWMPPELVLEVYKQEQRFYFQACGKPKGGGQLKMFAEAQADLDGHPFEFTWEQLMERWNKRPPKRGKRRYSDYHEFAKDFIRTARWVRAQMVNPPFMVFRDSPWLRATGAWPALPPAVRGNKPRGD